MSSPPPPDTETGELDRALETLHTRRALWPRVGVAERIALLEAVADRILALAPRWADTAARAQGVDARTTGEPWFLGPAASLRYVREVVFALHEVARFGRTRIRPERVARRPNGQLTIGVHPEGLWESAIPFRGELWLEPGVDRDTIPDLLGGPYRTPAPGGVTLVLGAGNVPAIPFRDTLHQLFGEQHVALLKIHPVVHWLGPILEEVLQPLIEGGWVRVAQGGAETGHYLCHHPLVDAVHMTGSDATHDAIVWGPRDGRAARKAADDPVLAKPMRSELGNVTPIVVVPGPWTEAELDHHAEHVAMMATMNAAFICVSGKVLITSADWDQREAFLDRVRTHLTRLPARLAWYPGARDRWRTFVDAHPDARVLSAQAPDSVPWTLITGLDPDRTDDPCFRIEPFCGVLSEVPLPGGTPADFLARAVPFCNDVLWGTLGANVLVHPSTVATHGEAVDAALDGLRYGGIAVNSWVGINYYFSKLSWGAFPGHTLRDVGSGLGQVHNTQLVARVQRSVLFAPFRFPIKPPWFPSHRRSGQAFGALPAFERRPSLVSAGRLIAPALRG